MVCIFQAVKAKYELNTNKYSQKINLLDSIIN